MTAKRPSLLARFDGAAMAFLVDACASGAPAGTSAASMSCRTAARPRFWVSTHGFGLAEAIELARALGQLPPRCIVYAIEGGSFETGAPLSPPAQAAVAEVSRRLSAEIDDQAKQKDDRRA